MGAALISGLANMGTTGLKAYNDGVDKKRRQAKEEEDLAWQNEQRDAIRAERAQRQQLNASLAEAARPAQVDTGYQVTDAAGSNAFTKDADAAAAMSDMVSDQRPSLASATRVQDTAYRDPNQAQAAEQQYNSTPATLGRMSKAAMPIDAERGLKLADSASTAAKTQKSLKDEEIAQVNELFNRQILSIASSGPDWSIRAAEALTKSNAPGLQGMTVEPAISQDGKMVSFKIVLPSGETKVVGNYENSERGAEQWVRDSARVDFKTKIGWLNENMKQERELEKANAKSNLTFAEIKARGDEERKTIDYRRNTGDGKEITREERLRYTSLFSDAGRRQSEAQKAYNTLLSSGSRYANAKPGSPQAQELQSLRDAIKQYADERRTYQSLLAEGASVKGQSLSSARNNQERESDRMQILQSELVKAKQAGNAGDVAALEREIARSSGKTIGLSEMQQPTRQASNVKPPSAAQVQGLPSGASIGAFDAGRGWQVRDSGGKLLGYVQE